MKKIFSPVLILLSLIIFSGCDTQEISNVKNSQYTNDFSLEDLFEDSGYCSSIEWSEEKHKKYGILVKMKCKISNENIIFKKQDTLVYKFYTTNNGKEISIFNYYYLNSDGHAMGKMQLWQAEALLKVLLYKLEAES